MAYKEYVTGLLKEGLEQGFLAVGPLNYYYPVEKNVPKSKLLMYTKLIYELAVCGTDWVVLDRDNCPMWKDPEA